MTLKLSSPYHGRKAAMPAVVSFKSLDDLTMSPLVFALSPDNPPTLANGKAITEVTTTDRFGRTVLADQDINGVRPALTFTFPVQTPTTIGLREGKKPVKITGPSDWWVVENPIVFNKTINPAVSSGSEGYGVVANPAGAEASYLDDDGISQKITFVTYSASTAPTGPGEMAVGANLATNISADLVGKYISRRVPNQVSGLVQLSQIDAMERFNMHLVFVNRYFTLCKLEIFAGLLKPDSGDIPLGADQALQVEYSVVPDGVHCELYKMTWNPQQIKCVEA